MSDRPFPPPNPSGLCMCGCGEPTTTAPRAYLAWRIEKGQHWRYLKGHGTGHGKSGRKGRIPWNKGAGGEWFNVRRQRWFVTLPDGRQVLRARVVAERTLGRPLGAEEVVHHINRDKTDDRPENLHVFASQSEHMRHHRATS